MNYRNRALLDLAHQMPCTLNIDGVCQGGLESEPAHSNQQIHGKGMSIKAHDVFFAAACRACHHELDHGTKFNKEEKREIWRHAFDKTYLLLWEMGFIKVAA